MNRNRLPVMLCIGLFSSALYANEDGTESTEEVKLNKQDELGVQAFLNVYEVLQHPRCLNCHPSGDAPLQGDSSQPHAMNITRSSTASGLECSACHQVQNSEAYGVIGGPPGAPNWHLPTAEMPLIFQERTATQLCAQLKNPEENGQKTLEDVFTHIAHDPLVVWGWSPGGKRTVPMLSHQEFVAQFKQWMDAGAPCP